ncbi:ANK ankyrin repeat protein [Aspergillus parasiticus SU-1]|uniref:ANK ankyrin repeat protein n=1 Tax=Aspergillus parasiticus (strain ATCC 56775 / NRRL 5862 / SRRC 143 / SU-1) TaxID=1403190 RepID=A0A0F0IFT6_ASPPU|nr:ANK ankyrin repeat protein [Aspergillus parasiticus SU-1]
MSTLLRKLRSKKKGLSERGNSSNEECPSRSQSLAPKEDEHHRSTTPPNDLWSRAERKLKENSELDKVLTESAKILESDCGLKLRPGDTSHHERLRDLLEERKWVIKLGNRNVGIGDQITNISKNVLAIKDIVNPAASASPPASLACAGIIACFSMVVQVAEQHALLLQGLESASGLIVRLHVMEKLYLHSQAKHAVDMLGEFQDTLVSIYSKILEFQARAVCYVHRHSASQLLRNIFKWDGWAELLQDFETSQKSLDRFTSLIGYSELAQRLEEILNTSRERDIWTTTSAQDERVKRFLNLLYTCPYKDRKDRNHKHVPGTCQWFTSHPKFKDWQQRGNTDFPGLLWVSADPGCGKSVLTRYIVDDLLLNTIDRAVCYFFFKDDFPDQRSATGALSVILRQIFIAQPQLLRDAVLDKLDTDGEKLVQSFSELWNILTSVSANPKAGEIICILDALDECQDSDRKQLISAVKEFYSGPHKSSKLKFLITSRPYDHIRRGFWELENKLPTIHLSGDSEEEVKHISREIGLVIEKRIDNIGEQRSLDKDERDMLAQQLNAVENRTYLWVSLTLDVLENIPSFTKGNVRRAIQDLPTTVDSAYEKILDRSSDKDKARVLLHIITAAMRPLTLEELSLALAVSAGHQSLIAARDDMEPKDRFRKTLRDLCGLFVVVIDGKVYLLHQTAKEFLVRSRSSNVNINVSSKTRWKHSLLSEDSHQILAEICTSYITFDRDQIDQENLYEESFDEYSSCYWSAHFREAWVHEGNPLIVCAQRMCDPNSNMYQMWSKVAQARRAFLPQGATTLLIASALGLTAVSKHVLATQNLDINSRDSKYSQSSLSWAAWNGYEATVRLLLATGKVDVESKSSDGQTPLSLAARRGHEGVVRELLTTGNVDINSKDSKYGQTPLSWAAERGHEAVVKLLLNTRKVDINEKDSFGWTALFWAALSGHEEVVKLLLAMEDIDIDAKDLEGQTALFWAARYGHMGVVNLFRTTGKIDINSKDLSWAARNGREAVLKRLLATEKIDIDSRDLDGHTPLFWAARKGDEAVVKLFQKT